MCLFYFGGFPRNPVYRPIVCQLSGGERVKKSLILMDNKDFRPPPLLMPIIHLMCSKMTMKWCTNPDLCITAYANSHNRHMTTWPHPGAYFILWQVHMLETRL